MADAPGPALCSTCATQIAGGLLACPACGWLVHSGRLRQHAAEAEACRAAGDVAGALEHWRTALGLLPTGTRQYQTVAAKIEELSLQAEQGAPAADSIESPGARASPGPQHPGAGAPAARQGPTWREVQPLPRKKTLGAVAATLAAVGLLLWKFKAVVVFLVTKGKFLLMGLTKSSTFFSMFLSMGAYWALFGWKFAVGLVVSIYIHEMGHVYALRRYGIKATAPMFIPGLGAVIRLKQYPTLPREDAVVGLAGPLWGLGAAVAAWCVSLATGWPAWAAIAKVGAWLNLFNLLPVWQLDGARGFRALVRWERFLVSGLFLAAWIVTHDGLLALLGIVALGVSIATRPADKPNRRILAYFAFLIAALSAMTMVPVERGALSASACVEPPPDRPVAAQTAATRAGDSHPLDRLNPQNVKPQTQRPRRQVAQAQPARPRGDVLGLEHRARLVEAGEGDREVVQRVAQDVRR